MISPCWAGCICSSFLMTTTDSATTSSVGQSCTVPSAPSAPPYHGRCCRQPRHVYGWALTVTVGQQLDQPIEAGVADSANAGGTAPDGLDGGRHKVLVYAADVGLQDAGLAGEPLNPQCQAPPFRGQPKAGRRAGARQPPTYLELTQDCGDVALVGQVGEDLQLTQKYTQTLGPPGCPARQASIPTLTQRPHRP